MTRTIDNAQATVSPANTLPIASVPPPVSDPPVEHLDDILVNARIYHRRWGGWPMRGWLDDFAAAGLVRYDDDADQWIRTSDHTAAIAGGARTKTSGERPSYA